MRRVLPVALTLLLGTSFSLIVGNPFFVSTPGVQPALAQRIRPDGVWRLVYDRLPDFPLENQYVNKETGKVDPENTLAGRLVRYHLYTKGRPPFYRLDWKITLAEYLEVHRVMEEVGYPSANTLRLNPVEGDIAAIKRLNRAQREALIQVLVDAFRPQFVNRPSPPATSPGSAQPPATPVVTPPAKPARGPGAAQLLQP
jgi:hypothetical protein